MRFAGSTSWRVSWGGEEEIDAALYVRDALALSVDEGQVLPPVEPSVPVSVPPGIDRAAVQAQWSDWWTDLLAYLGNRDDPDPDPRGTSARYRRPALAEDSAMRQVMADFAEPAARHNASFQERSRTRQLEAGELVGDLVRDAERHLGRRAKPFSLDLIEISVAGRVWQPLSDHQILVSSQFAEDRPALTRALREVIAKLV